MERRSFIKFGGVFALAGTAAYAGFLEDHSKAFTFEKSDKAMNNLYGSAKAASSDKVTLTVPDIAENGAAVPVTVATDLKDAVMMTLFVEKNPYPLIAAWEIHEGTIPEFSTRIRMGKTSDVTLVVKTKDGKLHMAKQQVKVTVGGCGG